MIAAGRKIALGAYDESMNIQCLETVTHSVNALAVGDHNFGVGIDKAAWQQELKLHDELFTQLAHNLPAEMPATKAKLAQRLAA